jgi:hypothetical protein
MRGEANGDAGDVANRRDRTLRIATVDVAYGRIPLKKAGLAGLRLGHGSRGR